MLDVRYLMVAAATILRADRLVEVGSAQHAGQDVAKVE